MDFQLTPHFSFYELTSTSHTNLLAAQRAIAEDLPVSGKLFTIASELLEPLRALWGRPITVNSGFRSKAVNDIIGGATSSQHMLGEAADITVGTPSDNKTLWLKAITLAEQGRLRFGQLILEPTWIHISLGRPYREAEGQVMTFDGKKYTSVRTISWLGK